MAIADNLKSSLDKFDFRNQSGSTDAALNEEQEKNLAIPRSNKKSALSYGDSSSFATLNNKTDVSNIESQIGLKQLEKIDQGIESGNKVAAELMKQLSGAMEDFSSNSTAQNKLLIINVKKQLDVQESLLKAGKGNLSKGDIEKLREASNLTNDYVKDRKSTKEDVHEAKAFSPTTYKMGKAWRDFKEENPRKEGEGKVKHLVRGAKNVVSKGMRNLGEVDEGEKWQGKNFKALGKRALTTGLHAGGIAAENPIFNLLASDMNNKMDAGRQIDLDAQAKTKEQNATLERTAVLENYEQSEKGVEPQTSKKKISDDFDFDSSSDSDSDTSAIVERLDLIHKALVDGLLIDKEGVRIAKADSILKRSEISNSELAKKKDQATALEGVGKGLRSGSADDYNAADGGGNGFDLGLGGDDNRNKNERRKDKRRNQKNKKDKRANRKNNRARGRGRGKGLKGLAFGALATVGTGLGFSMLGGGSGSADDYMPSSPVSSTLSTANTVTDVVSTGKDVVAKSGKKASTKAIAKSGKSGSKIAGLTAKGAAGAKGAFSTAKAFTKKKGGGLLSKIGGKAMAKMGGKAVAKSLVKKIPVIGLLAAVGFGASRMMKGDFAGAMGEVASGAASMIPGIGTAASLAIDAGLMAKDAGMIGGDKATESEATAEAIKKSGIVPESKDLQTMAASPKALNATDKVPMPTQKAEPEMVKTNTTSTDDLKNTTINSYDNSSTLAIAKQQSLSNDKPEPQVIVQQAPSQSKQQITGAGRRNITTGDNDNFGNMLYKLYKQG